MPFPSLTFRVIIPATPRVSAGILATPSVSAGILATPSVSAGANETLYA